MGVLSVEQSERVAAKKRRQRRLLYLFATIDAVATLFAIVTADALLAAFMGGCFGFVLASLLTD